MTSVHLMVMVHRVGRVGGIMCCALGDEGMEGVGGCMFVCNV